MGYYRMAQICMNGHCITTSYSPLQSTNQRYCQKCGASAITVCPSCKAKIRGTYDVEGICVIGAHYTVPAYCYYCGNPYPWTKTALEAAATLIQEDEGLSAEQREQLSASLPDIIVETPKTNLAVARIKKAFLTAGQFTVEGLRQFAIDFACELAKNQLGI